MTDECEPNEDCNKNGTQDICDIAAGISRDCHGDRIPDECQLTNDCNLDLIPDECQLEANDCDSNNRPDECDIADGVSADCNDNVVPDECDLAEGDSIDCNDNAKPDECDVASGESIDCNGNSIADSCDIAAGTSVDCDGLGIPDECEPDCNDNSIADGCDISSGTSEDCNFDGVPDECQPGGTEDCDGNGTADLCDLFLGLALDCNENEIPDACDILFGVTEDCNGNLVPDECDVAPDALLSAGDARSDFVESIANLGYRVMSVDRNAFPPDLSSFQVIILGPAGVPGDPATVSAIDEFVANGGSMIRIQDNPSTHTQYSGDARPILDATGFAQRTNTQIIDPDSPLTAGLSTTSTLTGYSAVYTLKPEAEVVLAWDDGEAMTVYYPYGDGKVIYFNDLWAAYVYLWKGDTAYGLALMQNSLNETKGPELDCNRNGNPDACDIADGRSTDVNGNGIPDECEDLCPADIDGDGDIDSDDFFAYLDAVAAGNVDICDIDGDADCDAEDFFGYLDLFAAGC
ncbi:MAG: hypothetical protein IIB38_14925 [Candidatus Hydrogenedentes bacterium]|nr:hypothetical protein [Candidatus Hydrogenedentota bacterium]